MNKLDMKTIEELASRPGVKRIAVENFLMTLGDNDKKTALTNLGNDALVYNWNAVTFGAIYDGIIIAEHGSLGE